MRMSCGLRYGYFWAFPPKTDIDIKKLPKPKEVYFGEVLEADILSIENKR